VVRAQEDSGTTPRLEVELYMARIRITGTRAGVKHFQAALFRLAQALLSCDRSLSSLAPAVAVRGVKLARLGAAALVMALRCRAPRCRRKVSRQHQIAGLGCDLSRRCAREARCEAGDVV
jgi:hypothetical protein